MLQPPALIAIEFDPAKDAANLAQHGVSLARAEELDVKVVVVRKG